MTIGADSTPATPAVEAQRTVSFIVDGARLTIRRIEEFDGRGPTGIAVSWTVEDVGAFAADSTDRDAAVHRVHRVHRGLQ